MNIKKILFVDDDFITIEGIVNHLELSGHKVEVVDMPLDAIEQLTTNKFDCVFLDVMLPPGPVFDLEETTGGRYTGLRLLKMIRTDRDIKGGRKLRVFLITNWRDQPQVEQAAKEHGATILRKPLSLAQIDEALK